MDDQSPAANLLGKDVDGWEVVRRLERSSVQHTVGDCSYCYEVRKEGRSAFLKAIDLNRMLRQPEGKTLTARALHGQHSEAALLHRCQSQGLTRVIAHFGGGVWIDPDSPAAAAVPYVVTEWAEGGDLRKLLMSSEQVATAVILAALRDLAAGIQQIHQQQIAHLDLKPSNALGAAGRTKIGDFGHAVSAESDFGAVRGTHAYAPPETLYGPMPESFSGQRAIDLYLLGSMIAGVFMKGIPVTALALQRIEPALHHMNYDGTFGDVLPYLEETYLDVFEILHDLMPPQLWGRDRLASLITQLCWPDPRKRGLNREKLPRHGDRLNVRRVIAELDLVAQRAIRGIAA